MSYDEKLSLQQCKLREIDYPYCKYDEQLHQQYIVPRLSSEIEYPIVFDRNRHKILLFEDPRLSREPEHLNFKQFKTVVKLCGQTKHLSEGLLVKFINLPLSRPTIEIEAGLATYPGDPVPRKATRKSEKNVPLSGKDIEIIIDFTKKYSFPFVPYQVNNETLKNKPRSNYFEWFRECHSQFVSLVDDELRIKYGADLSYEEYLIVKDWFRLDVNLQQDFLPPKRPKIRYSTLQPHFPFTRLVSLIIKIIEDKQITSSHCLARCVACNKYAYVGQQHDSKWFHCQETSCINAVKNWKRRGKPKSQQSK